MQDTHIGLAHGNGGRYMHELIEEVFGRSLANPDLDTASDAARMPVLPDGDILMSTDGFTVQPLEFPGGNIGSLAAHGTINDLGVAGADPLYFSLNCFIEEGLEMALLERVIVALSEATAEAGVRVIAGDTKVVPRGEGGGIYLATTGIGVCPAGISLGLDQVREGDRLLVSGPVGDHGIAVMLAREQFGLRGDLQSDAASVLPLTRCGRDMPGVRFMRDPTRGGLATVAHEIHRAAGLQVRLSEPDIPVRDPVRSVCEMLGYDPYYLACEGRVVAVVAPDKAEALLTAWKDLPEGRDAAVIGELVSGRRAVVMSTEIGGERMLEELEEDPLPRIC
ncbi:MAG: hydrogenase expression/formation protein HypE [Gammaproteobacteria bacterium]|jgi:hydrogenase expression/formation protein HypE